MEDPVDEMDPQSHSGLTIKNRRKKFMKRKQLAALAAATVMALSLVGCGGGSRGWRNNSSCSRDRQEGR